MIREPFTQQQIEVIRASYGRRPAGEIAAECGRSVQSVYRCAARLGLSRPLVFASDQIVDETIRELHPQGYSDAEIAAEICRRANVAGCDRHRVAERRQRMHLSHNAYSDRSRARVRAKTREQLDAAGLSNLAALRSETYAKWKRRLGWPDHLTVRAVQALEMFYQHGPLTRVGLCQLMGVSSRKRTAPTSNAKGGTVLAELQRAGLICRVRKGKPIPGDLKVHDDHGGSRPRKTNRAIKVKYLDVYMLAPGVQPHGRETTEHTPTGPDRRADAVDSERHACLAS